MKKLLSAVTSMAMSLSLTAGAFIPSTYVSAAGNVAVQPNVSIGDAQDYTALKTASTDIPDFDKYDDFVVYAENSSYEANPGETIEVIYKVNTGSHPSAAILKAVLATLPEGFSYEYADTYCYAAGDFEWEDPVDDQLYCKILDGAEPSVLDTSEDLLSINYTVPTTPGEYSVDFTYFQVTEDGKTDFLATTTPTTIIVKGDSEETTTTAPAETDTPEVTTTTPSADAPDFEKLSDFIIYPNETPVEAEPGSKITVEYMVETSDAHNSAAILKAVLRDLPEGFSYEYGDTFCYAAGEFEWEEPVDDQLYCKILSGAEPTVLDTSESVLTIDYTVPTTPGEYTVDFSYFQVTLDGTTDALATTKPLTVIVKEAGEVTTTTEPPVTTTETPETTTTVMTELTTTEAPVTTEAPTPASGKVEWVIPEVEGKPGETVVLDVTVKGASDLAVAGAQFEISATDPIAFSSVSGSSAAYSSTIVNNADTNEFAFGEGVGNGIVASDRSVVLSLTYTIPENTADGEYPVTWANAFVSDTNGLEITDNVTLTNGKIIVKADEKFEGNIAWQIDKVTAKPGETVQVPVIVKDTDGAALPVAGAQFAITADSPIEFASVDANSAAYNSSIVNNKETNEFAFGNGVGAGVAAADGSNVLILSYTVPAGTPAGEYPVKWGGDIYISDTNGNALTSQISLIDGAIIVEDDTITGDIIWDIADKVEGAPGETVEVPVTVKVNGENLPVAGAQFKIIGDTVAFAGVSETSAAYGASIVNNPDTNEFAFGEGKGQGITADDGSVVLTLKYTIPEDAADGTEYPVTWSDAFISDTNGNEITVSVTLEPGSIIVKAPETTTTEATTTEEVTTTTEATTTEEETTTTEATTTEEETTTTTVVTAPEGQIVWQIPTVEAQPGEEVSMEVVIVDTNNSALPIAGAQFGIKAVSPIEYVGADGSTAYGATIVSNPDTAEFAFANSIGDGVAGADGAIVLTLKYKVPEDCADGEYPVEFTEGDYFNVSSADGLDITAQVYKVNGAIIVKSPETTTTTEETTTTTEETTTTTEATTTEEETTTTTVVTAPEGQIVWQIPTVEAQPGEEVSMEVVIVDTNNSALPIAGAQFGIKAVSPIEYVGADGSTAYGATIVSNPDTAEFAFANSTGDGVVGADGAIVLTLKYKVPEDCADGEYPVEFTEGDYFNVSSADGLDITAQVYKVNGAIIVKSPETTTTTEETTTTTEETTTTTEATTTEEVTTTTEPIQVQDGMIIWQADTVYAQPGEEVTLDIKVLDPNGTELRVSGAQFVINSETVELVKGSDSSEAYSAAITQNNNEFAFANGTGNYTIGADGSIVITLTYKVPEDCAEGTYPVSIADLFASDENGLDITGNIETRNGAIIVTLPETTTTTEATTTTTETTTTTTSEPETTTTTTVTAPAGHIIWQIPTVEAQPGEEVSMEVVINDANNSALPIAGAQFGIKAVSPIEYVGADGSTAYGATIVSNPDTAEFAFANSIGDGVVGADGAIVLTLKYKVPEDCADGEYPVEFTTGDYFNISSADGLDITANVERINGAIIVKSPETTTTTEETTTETTTTTGSGDIGEGDDTNTTTDVSTTQAPDTGEITTTTTGEPSNPYAVGTVVDGFYFNHDPRPYDLDHIAGLQLITVNEDGTESLPADFDPSKITFKSANNGSDNPMDTFTINEKFGTMGAFDDVTYSDFVYDINVYYDGEKLTYADGTDVKFKAYIGVKGDSDFDGMADATDATTVLVWYAAMSTGGDPANTQFALDTNRVYTAVNASTDLSDTEKADLIKELDELAAFLCDVDLDVYSADNWRTLKAPVTSEDENGETTTVRAGRVIDATDSSAILGCYASVSTGSTLFDAWNDAIANRKEDMTQVIDATGELWKKMVDLQGGTTAE